MGLFWQISPTVQTVDGSVPPSYDEANAGAYYSILTNIVKYRFLVLFIHLFFLLQDVLVTTTVKERFPGMTSLLDESLYER